MSNNRPFRSVTAKQYKNIVYRGGLKCSSSATANLFVDGMSTSTLYTAVPYHSKGSILPLPVNHALYTNPVSPPVIFAHPGTDLQDLAFSPHAANVLVSVAKDDNLRVFELPESGALEQSINTPSVAISGLTGAGSVAWHPTVRGLIAVGCKDSVAIVSVDYDNFGKAGVPESAADGRVILQIPTQSGVGKDIVRVQFSYNGQYVVAIGKDGGFYVFDPRQVTDYENPQASLTSVFGEMKNPHYAAFIGEQSLQGPEKVIFVAGLGRARRPCYRVVSWNPETGALTPMVHGDFTSSPGQLLAKYDHDTQLVYLATRSAQSALIFDTTLVSGVNGKPNAGAFVPLISVPIPSGTKGFSQVPKTALNVEDSEIINFYSHQGDNVELYSISVLRKDRGYSPELYPNTFAGVSGLEFDDYMDKKNVQPAQISLSFLGTGSSPTPITPEPIVAQSSASGAAAATAATVSNAIATPESAVNEPSKSSSQLIAEQKGYDRSVRSNLDSAFARTTFLHCSGTEPGFNKDHYSAYDLKLPKQHIPFGRTLMANNTMWAIPIATSGGSILYPRLLTQTGRVPTKPTGIMGPSPISAMSISQFTQYQLATASEDGVLRVYNLPKTWTSGELPSNLDTPAFTFELNVRIQVVEYHKYVENCIVATGYDANMQAEVLFIFDVTPGTEGEQRYQAYPNVVRDRACYIDFSPDGVHIAVANNKSEITIVSMPGGEVKQTIAHGSQLKESWGLWYSPNYLVTIGFVRGGERGVTLHKIDWEKNTSTVVKSLSFYNTYLLIPHLDITTGVLLLGGLGTANYNVFFISPESAPYVDSLSTFSSRGDVVSMAYLPKANVDVTQVEIVKSIKLNQSSEVWPISWRLPRKRKEYFQDDVYTSGAPKLQSIVTSAEYFNAALEGKGGLPVDRLSYQSLRPEGMGLLSEAPDEELTDRQQKYITMKHQQYEVEKPKGFLGHTTNEEVQQHYIEKMDRVGVNGRWSVKNERDVEDVSDSEWD